MSDHAPIPHKNNGLVPQTTVERLLSGHRRQLPRWNDQVEPVLLALRQYVAQQRRQHPDALLGTMANWKAAHAVAEYGNRPVRCPLPPDRFPLNGTRVRPGRPIGQLRPLDLEVHPAIDAGAKAAGLAQMLTYVRRRHDELLAELVD